jgi:alpha-galactosidase
VMSSWVTDEPDRLDTAPASLEFRFVVAMAGALGIGADLLAWDEPTRARARELVDLYGDIREVVHTGEVRRLGQPSDPVYAVQYTAADASRVVVLVTARPGAGGGDVPVRLPLAGLRDDTRYRVHAGAGAVECGVLAGDELAGAGVPVPFALAPDCDVVVLDRLQ